MCAGDYTHPLTNSPVAPFMNENHQINYLGASTRGMNADTNTNSVDRCKHRGILSIKTFLKGKTSLALASGVSAHNVTSFLPFVDAFLVATSITARDTNRGNHEYLLPEKVKSLAHLIHT